MRIVSLYQLHWLDTFCGRIFTFFLFPLQLDVVSYAYISYRFLPWYLVQYHSWKGWFLQAMPHFTSLLTAVLFSGMLSSIFICCLDSNFPSVHISGMPQSSWKLLIFSSFSPYIYFMCICWMIITREAMIPCILLALGGNLVDGMFSSVHYSFIYSRTKLFELCLVLSLQKIYETIMCKYPCIFFHNLSIYWNLNSNVHCHVAGPGSSRLGFKTTAAIIFGRLVLVPPVGLGIVTLADRLGFIPAGDKMFKFVLLLQHTMPTSVLSGKHPFLTSILRLYICSIISCSGSNLNV